MLMMRKFVSERLSAAVEEILGVVEHTVADYQTEVSRLKKEVCCLRSQLDLLQPEIKHVADIRHVAEPVSQEHVLPELYHCDQMPGPSLWQDPTPLRTKEEPQDLEPTELPEDPKPLLTKVEEEPFDISEGLEGDVIKLVLHPASAMSGFCPPLSPDFATAPSGNSDFSVKRKRGRPRRDDAGADPVRRQNYLERAAANQRQYRARRDTDPVKRQNYLEREKARWREARKTGKKKMPLSSQERTKRFRTKMNEDPTARKEFLEKRRASYQKRKQDGNISLLPVRMLDPSKAEKKREQWRRNQRSRRARLKQMQALMSCTPESRDGDNLGQRLVQHRQEPEQRQPPHL